MLTGGEDVVPSPGRRRALVGIAVVLALLTGAADNWKSDRERGLLLRYVTAGEQTVDDSQSSLLSLTAYSAGLLYSADIPDSVRSSAYDNLARDAERWRPRLERARRDVAATPVLPWHRDTRAARQAYEQRLTAWIDVLADYRAAPQSGQRDGDAAVTASREAAVTTTREAAAQALVAAGVDQERVRALLG